MNSRLLYQYCIILIAISLPWNMAISSVMTILCGVLWLITPGKSMKALKWLIPIFLFVALMAISILYSDDWQYGLKLIERKLSLILFPIFIATLAPDKKTIKQSLYAFVFSCLIACLASHTAVVYKLIDSGDEWFNIFNKNYSYQNLTAFTGLHTSYFGLYLIFASGILMVHLSQHKKYRLAIVLLLSYFLFFTFHLSARTPIFTMYLLIVFYSIFHQYKKGRLWKGIGVFVLINVLIVSLLYSVRVTRYRFQQVFGFTYHNGTTANDGAHKLNLWGAAIAANNAFLFGEGIGDAKNKIIDSLEERGLHKEHKKQLNAHNQYIETYVANGLVGLLLYLFLCLALLRYFIRQNNPYGVILILAFMCCSFTESMLERNKGIVFISYFSMLLIQLKPKEKNIDI